MLNYFKFITEVTDIYISLKLLKKNIVKRVANFCVDINIDPEALASTLISLLINTALQD